jgi:hypothetical protein
MTTETMIALLKLRLGIASSTRDTYLLHLLDSTAKMLDDEKGINVDLANDLIANFIINYSAWVYESKGEMGGMPRHLQYALHNLMIHNLKVVDESV